MPAPSLSVLAWLTGTRCCWQLQTTTSRGCVSSAPASLSKDEDAGRFHGTKKGSFHEIFNLTENERPLAGTCAVSPRPAWLGGVGGDPHHCGVDGGLPPRFQTFSPSERVRPQCTAAWQMSSRLPRTESRGAGALRSSQPATMDRDQSVAGLTRGPRSLSTSQKGSPCRTPKPPGCQGAGLFKFSGL